jgi:hypothetical protein
MPDLDPQSAIFFANDLRSARLAALADAEAFDEIIHVVERLGYYLTKEGLGDKGEYGNLGNSTINIRMQLQPLLIRQGCPSRPLSTERT